MFEDGEGKFFTSWNVDPTLTKERRKFFQDSNYWDDKQVIQQGFGWERSSPTELKIS